MDMVCSVHAWRRQKSSSSAFAGYLARVHALDMLVAVTRFGKSRFTKVAPVLTLLVVDRSYVFVQRPCRMGESPNTDEGQSKERSKKPSQRKPSQYLHGRNEPITATERKERVTSPLRAQHKKLTHTSLTKRSVTLLAHERPSTKMNCLGVLHNITAVTKPSVTALTPIESLRLAMDTTSVGLNSNQLEAGEDEQCREKGEGHTGRGGGREGSSVPGSSHDNRYRYVQ